MPNSSLENDGKPQKQPKSIAEYLFPLLKTDELSQQLERFRVEWEALNGPTDFTRNYTSMWPEQMRGILWKNDPKRCFDGFPPFAQEFIKLKMDLMAQEGLLDDANSTYLSMYMKGQLNKRDSSWER